MTIESDLDKLIQKLSSAKSHIDDLILQVEQLENQKKEACELATFSLSQLRMLQEDINRLDLADHDKHISKLQKLASDQKQELFDKDSELKNIIEDLEHYFIQSQQQSIMLKEYEKLQEHTSKLFLNSFGWRLLMRGKINENFI